MSSGILNELTGYHNRRSIRLRHHDYSKPGAYFITVCIHDRKQRLFGDIVDGRMMRSDAGDCAQKCLLEIPKHFPQAGLDEFIVMPNHVHFIIMIRDFEHPVGVQDFEPLRKHRNTQTSHTNRYQHVIPRSIGSIVRGFKTGVTKWYRPLEPATTLWQRNYHDHVIRNDKSLYFMRKYIRDNPLQWSIDSENQLAKETAGSYHEDPLTTAAMKP
jgi:REP element-mobilizing transposase RayT